KRHRNISKILDRHFEKIHKLIKSLNIDIKGISDFRKLLIGSYFTHEYSIESAAFFNPSIVEDPDQSELEDGEKRIIISFRAVGEGHISSIAFRRALIDRENNVHVIPSGNYVDEAEIVRNARYERKLFFEKATVEQIDMDVLKEIEGKIDETFEYSNLRKVILDSQKLEENDFKRLNYEKILWLSDSYHDLSFSLDTDISDRVYFRFQSWNEKVLKMQGL